MSERFFDVSGYVYAHRGLWGGTVPENSLAAFEAARAAGYGIELDVRLTMDGLPVVFHDATLERMCGRDEVVDRLKADEMSVARLPDGSHIPSLERALDVMEGLPVLIELKVDDNPSDIAERVAAVINGRRGLLAVMSFDEPTVAQLCRLVTDRPIGLLVAPDNNPMQIATKAATARGLGCDYVGPHHSILSEMAETSGGLPMVTWTVRTDKELTIARQYGAAPVFEGPGVQL
jgi:glycerophosphoryl diester phosphodiesterase